MDNSKIFKMYVPTDGDIIDGNMVMFKINNKWTEPCNFDSFLGPSIQDCKQGIEYSCTSDVIVGDEIFLKKDLSKGVVKDIDKYGNLNVLSEGILKKYKRKSLFKIIE